MRGTTGEQPSRRREHQRPEPAGEPRLVTPSRSGGRVTRPRPVWGPDPSPPSFLQGHRGSGRAREQVAQSHRAGAQT